MSRRSYGPAGPLPDDPALRDARPSPSTLATTAPVRPLPAPFTPHPHPSRGAGGPLRRAAGWVSCEPLVLLAGADALRAHLAGEALAGAGFTCVRRPGSATFAAELAGVHLLLVDLAEPLACRALPVGAARRRPVTAGYQTGRPLSLAAHAAHHCVDLLLELTVAGGRAVLLPVDADAGGDLTRREGDVLALVLAGLSDRQIASELCVSPATARSHVRSLLRRLAAGDRAELRRRDRLA